jgi:hypothetical protein
MKGYLPFAPASHPPGASISPRPFRNENLDVVGEVGLGRERRAFAVAAHDLLPELVDEAVARAGVVDLAEHRVVVRVRRRSVERENASSHWS